MKSYVAPEALQRVFEVVEQCAAAGERCPQNDQLGSGGKTALPMLARMGRVRIEIYEKNFRVVTIMEGPHKGARTQEPPGKRRLRPYMVIEKESPEWPRRQAPSLPRPLTREELER